MTSLTFSTQQYDISLLKQPVIHTLPEIQSHGILFVLSEPDLIILQVSRNTQQLSGFAPDVLLGQSLEMLLDVVQMEQIQAGLRAQTLDQINPSKIWIRRQGDEYGVFDAVFYRTTAGVLVMECEPAIAHDHIPFLSFYHFAKASISRITTTTNLHDFCHIIVQDVRSLTDFDRVMLYRFNEDNHGEVLAEAKIDALDSYLGLHFPESDIPAPARQLFLSKWIRAIPDVTAPPVPLYPPLHPETQQPTDLTLSILRSPFACHVDYLKNMGVGASLTISLIKDQRLWGLITCHHRTPKQIPYELRKACEFLGRVIFAELSIREEEEDHLDRINLAQVQSDLIKALSEANNFVVGLVKTPMLLLDLVRATGAAIYCNDQWTLVGQTPAREDLDRLGQWLTTAIAEDVFVTNALPSIYGEAERFKGLASGLLAIPVSRHSFVIWFRPEILQTVNWGGNPQQAYHVEETDGKVKLCPRQSFELWKETVRLTALPWQSDEVQAVLKLRKAIIKNVLRQAETLALLAQDLERSNAELRKFAYVASHDLQEPLNQVSSYVQLLEQRYDEVFDQDAKDFISFAVDGVSLMQTLIDDVLAYSKVDSREIECELVDVSGPIQRAIANVQRQIGETQAYITWDEMPVVMADSTQLMQLFQNLISNGIKFHRPDTIPQIHIGMQRQDKAWQFTVQDNGIGLEPQFAERVFVIFQRLHTRDEYDGSGIGLAICKKIVECHRGRIWVESNLSKGSTFYFTLPR